MGAALAIDYLDNVAPALHRGLEAFRVHPPLSLDAWARKHFYLSTESSYVEQEWTPWPFQRAIMAVISHDDVREVNWQKAARTGNTKIMLAAIGYFAQHKRRNQAIWQPTDDDRDEFVKTELDPMLRDVAVMQSVFPAYLARHKDNTLQQKSFLGSKLHMKGGKAAKNYRRISVDVVYLDEIDGFDDNVEKEGDPISLAVKRVEGATFPKIIIGSTPKLKANSLIEQRIAQADVVFEFVVPCVHCGAHHPITWGGKDQDHGFKWHDKNPETVAHLCRSCSSLMTQSEYLSVWDQGYFLSRDGAIELRVDEVTGDPEFISSVDQSPVAPPAHVGFDGVWTGYSPAASWPSIVKDFLHAHTQYESGNKSYMQTFWNLTLGRAWEIELEKTDADDLIDRAEPFPLRHVPMNCLLLLCGIDTQDNRLEANVWGYGRGSEMWTIDHQVFWGDPSQDAVWEELEEWMGTEYVHAAGTLVPITAFAIDSQGHNTHAVYNFVSRQPRNRVFAVAGRGGNAREKAIKDGVTRVDIDWRGKTKRRGLMRWMVGTNLAKDLFFARLHVERPGPGYVHLSSELSDEIFKQLTGEARADVQGPRGNRSRWVALRKRVEALDCTVYAIWLEAHLELARKSDAWWDALEERIQPANGDLFAQSASASASEPVAMSRPPARQAPSSPAQQSTSVPLVHMPEDPYLR